MERQRSLSEAQKKLLDEQALLNQREADILNKSQVLRRIEKELEATGKKIERGNRYGQSSGTATGGRG